RGESRFIAASAFCCGLAFWDKAVFAWMLAGLCAGSLIFIRRIRRRLSPGSVAIVLAALIAGALPLVVFNVASEPRFSTARSNAHLAPSPLFSGLRALRATWNGEGSFNITQETAPRPNAPEGAI